MHNIVYTYNNYKQYKANRANIQHIKINRLFILKNKIIQWWRKLLYIKRKD